MDIQRELVMYLSSPHYDEEDVWRGIDPRAEIDAFPQNLHTQLVRHEQQLMRRRLAGCGAAIVLPTVTTTVSLLNATPSGAGETRDAIYQNAFELIGECGREGIAPLLVSSMEPDPEARAFSMMLLGCHAPPTPAMVDAGANLLMDHDTLVRWAAAAAIVLWGDGARRELRAAARSILITFATRAMHLHPEAAATLIPAALETSPDYAHATLLLRLLPQLLGTRGSQYPQYP